MSLWNLRFFTLTRCAYAPRRNKLTSYGNKQEKETKRKKLRKNKITVLGRLELPTSRLTVERASQSRNSQPLPMLID